MNDDSYYEGDANEDDDAIVDEGEQGFHGELREIIEQAQGTDLEALIPHAEALLALSEDTVAALVAAAQSMVGAVNIARADCYSH